VTICSTVRTLAEIARAREASHAPTAAAHRITVTMDTCHDRCRVADGLNFRSPTVVARNKREFLSRRKIEMLKPAPGLGFAELGRNSREGQTGRPRRGPSLTAQRRPQKSPRYEIPIRNTVLPGKRLCLRSPAECRRSVHRRGTKLVAHSQPPCCVRR